jgi:nitrogen fixation NifU-like protein
MSNLRELYQEVIFDHNRRPRNKGRPARVDRTSEGFNALCGDQITLYLAFDESGKVSDVGFEGQGCAISTASASLMTEALRGLTEAEADKMFQNFYHMVMGQTEVNPDVLGKLHVLVGVQEFPARVKCATLAWHTMQAALRGESQVSEDVLN